MIRHFGGEFMLELQSLGFSDDDSPANLWEPTSNSLKLLDSVEMDRELSLYLMELVEG